MVVIKWPQVVVGVGLCLLVLVGGCNRELEVPPPDTSLYPIVAGKFRTYKVYDTTFIIGIGGIRPVPRHFLRQELTTTTETDLLGRNVHLLELWKALPDSVGGGYGPFEFDFVWTQWKSDVSAERIEGNTRFEVMRFPVSRGRAWDGNRFNDFGSSPSGGQGTFKIIATDSTIVLEGRVFPNCTVVEWRNISQSIIFDVHTYEVYAPNIGKIKRFDKFYKTDVVDNNSELSTDSYVHHEYMVNHNF